MDPLHCAIETALDAGRLLIERVGLPLEASEKSGRGDFVTASDRASEAAIVKRLRADFPAATILGEEDGVRYGTSDERWIVDPLDGTTNYAHGYPMFCVSIAYERAGEVVAAALYAPALDELYAAERGAGATRNGTRTYVSATARLAEALACTGFLPGDYDRNAENFARVARAAQGIRRDGTAALDLAFVAAGRFDAFWEFDLKAWDVAAGALLVREAGGTVSAIDGGPFTVGGGSTLASNGRLHAEMLPLLGDGAA